MLIFGWCEFYKVQYYWLGGYYCAAANHTRLQIKEKQGDKVARIQHGDMAVYDDLFFSGCPKFLSPVVSENPTSPFGSR